MNNLLKLQETAQGQKVIFACSDAIVSDISILSLHLPDRSYIPARASSGP